MTFMAIKLLLATLLLLQPSSPQWKVFQLQKQQLQLQLQPQAHLEKYFHISSSLIAFDHLQWPLMSAFASSLAHFNEWLNQQVTTAAIAAATTTASVTSSASASASASSGFGISLAEARPPRPTATLFYSFDGVNSLNSDNFTSIYSRTCSFLVLFYATWCGHCKAFAPSYRSLALDVVAWRPVIEVAAVNCADPYNTKLCREQGVMAYPTLKFFPPFSPSNDRGSEFIIAATTIDSMRSTLIHAIMEYIRSTLPPPTTTATTPTSGYPGHSHPSHWPDLLPVNASTLSELIYRVTFHRKISPQPDHRPIVLIIEPFNSDVGCEVILDLSGYQRYIKVYRVIYNLANPVINELISSLGLNTITVPLPLVIQVVSNNSNVHHADHFPGPSSQFNSPPSNSKDPTQFTVSGSGYKLILLTNTTSTSSTEATSREWILRRLVSQFLADVWFDLKAQLNESRQQLTSTSSANNNSNYNYNSNGNNNSVNSVALSPGGASSLPNLNSVNEDEDEDGDGDDSHFTSISKASSSLSSTPTSISPSESIDSEVDSTDTILIDTQQSQQVHIVDLHNAIRYALNQEVLLHSKIGPDEMDVVKNLFNLLNRFFPFSNENVRRFIRRMSQWSVLRNGTNAESLQAIMKAGSEGFLPPMQNYITCRGSKREFRGYPCAFWLVFHTLTVSEYKSMKRRNVTAHEVLPLMKLYVKTFFTCKSCSEHFDQLTSNLPSKLIYQNSSVLLLWQIHNIVNQNTSGSASEDPYFPKVPYPPTDVCPKCQFGSRSKGPTGLAPRSGDQSNNNNNLNYSGANDWNVDWNLEEVFTFLTNRYDRTKIIRKTFPGRSSSSSSSSMLSLSSRLLNQITIATALVPLVKLVLKTW